MAKKSKKVTRRPNTKALAVVCLLLNILILPGIGSLIGGKTKEGIWQVIIAVLGLLLFYYSYFGILILLAAWIWALISGIKLIQEAH